VLRQELLVSDRDGLHKGGFLSGRRKVPEIANARDCRGNDTGKEKETETVRAELEKKSVCQEDSYASCASRNRPIRPSRSFVTSTF
jgi:hypothetical protein